MRPEQTRPTPATQLPTSRRRLLKLVGTGTIGAGLAAADALPRRWTKPVIDTVVVPLHAQASFGAVNFQSATLGQTGLTGGYSVTSQFLGVRFTLAAPGTTTAIGAHIYGTGTVWAAVVRLTSLSDFPDSTDMSTSDVLGTAVLTLPATSAEVQAPLVLNLTAGTYAIVIGNNGLFGTSGNGAMPSNNADIGSPSYFFVNGVVWANGGFSSVRMFLI